MYLARYTYVSTRIKNTEDPLCRFHGPYLESTKAVRVLDEWNRPKSPLHTHYAYTDPFMSKDEVVSVGGNNGCLLNDDYRSSSVKR